MPAQSQLNIEHHLTALRCNLNGRQERDVYTYLTLVEAFMVYTRNLMLSNSCLLIRKALFDASFAPFGWPLPFLGESTAILISRISLVSVLELDTYCLFVFAALLAFEAIYTALFMW